MKRRAVSLRQLRFLLYYKLRLIKCKCINYYSDKFSIACLFYNLELDIGAMPWLHVK